MKERLKEMMKLTEEFKALALTARINALCDKSKEIGDRIGDLPVIFFPEQHKELIELGEEEYDLETRLYQLYIENGEYKRAALMLNAEAASEKALFLLKRDLLVI